MVARRQLILVIAVLLALVAVFYWQNQRLKKAQEDTGLASSRVLSAVFAARSELKVARLSGEILAEAKGCSLRCWVANGQQTRAPYSVDYFLNLKNLSASAYRWNAKDRIMSVDVPAITVDRPNIDMTRAQTRQSGAWISRDSSIAMQQQAATYLVTGAAAKANSAENLARAQDAGRAALARFLEAPFAAAGMPGVKVVVRFPGEPKPAGISAEQWDMSRSIAEVLADHR